MDPTLCGLKFGEHQRRSSMSAAITLLARFLAAVVAVFTLLQSSANAQEKLKIGIITTL
jgi:hypothetical protein